MLLFGWALLPDEEPDLNMEWCEEYHPKLTYSECADVAPKIITKQINFTPANSGFAQIDIKMLRHKIKLFMLLL